MKNLLLLVAFLLASCAPVATTIPTSTPTQIPTQTPTLTATSTSTPTITPSPTPVGGGSGQLIFTYKSYFETDYFEGGYRQEDFPNLLGESNIFISNRDGTELRPITNDLGTQNFVEGISPDGDKVLVSSFGAGLVGYSNSNLYGDLYLIDLTSNVQPLKLASRIYKRSLEPITFWSDDSRVVYAALYGGKRGIFVINSDGTGLLEIKVPEGNEPFQILGVRGSEIYWSSWNNQGVRIWQSNINGSDESKLLYSRQGGGPFSVSPNGEIITWIQIIGDGINISSPEEMEHVRTIQIPNVSLFKMFWSPDSSKIMLCDYWELPYLCYILSLQDFSLTEIPNAPPRDDELIEITQNVSWSPDSRQVILQNFIFDTKLHRVVGHVTRMLDLNAQFFSDEFTEQVFVFAWDHILWLPATK